jgi:hypothetical protein
MNFTRALCDDYSATTILEQLELLQVPGQPTAEDVVRLDVEQIVNKKFIPTSIHGQAKTFLSYDLSHYNALL